MTITRTVLLIAGLALVPAALPLVGCEKKPEPATPAASPGGNKPADGHDHAAGDGHDHDDGHDHGASTDLGEQRGGDLVVRASRDGDLKPGTGASVDATISGGAAKIVAVRFWIGTEDAKGSVKAKAEPEHDAWHTHVETPSPLPPGAKLWVEVETEGGARTTLGFDLKA